MPPPTSCADLTLGGTFDQCGRALICAFPTPPVGCVSVMDDHTPPTFQSCGSLVWRGLFRAVHSYVGRLLLGEGEFVCFLHQDSFT